MSRALAPQEARWHSFAVESYVVYGAGGHAKVVADTLAALGHTVVAFVEDGSTRDGAELMGVVIRPATWLFETRPAVSIGFGIGDNVARETVMRRCVDAGFRVPPIVHPSAVVARSAKLEDGSFVGPGAIVNALATVGTGVIVNSGAILEHDVRVGSFVHVCPRACVAGGVTIGARAQIGVGATVLDDINVGSDTLVGGGALVNRHLPNEVVAFGVPAKVRRGIRR